MPRRRPQLPPDPSLNRRTGTAKPLSRIVAFCEGQTETLYLQSLANHVGRRLFEVEFVSEVGVPETVVERCVERKRELDRAAQRDDADSFDANFSVWAVFDRDEHPGFDNAILAAQREGIRLAVSNPCAELWAVLHLEDHGDRHVERGELQSRLKQLMPGYDHRRSPVFDFLAMHEHYAAARDRALRLSTIRQEAGAPFGCPVTTIFELTDLIIASARPPRERGRQADALRARIAEIEASEAYCNGTPAAFRERSRLHTQLKDLDD